MDNVTTLETAHLPPRFKKYVEVLEDGCWRWTGYCDGGGYGLCNVPPGWRHIERRRKTRSHRFAYMCLVGPIPAGLQLDHLCRNRACCNPAHLEPVTLRENVLRGATGMKTHCIRGHSLSDPENVTLRHRNGHPTRCCRTCRGMHADAAKVAYRDRMARVAEARRRQGIAPGTVGP